MTYEPMTDAELLALEEKWRDVIPPQWQGVTGPLTPEQEKDLERYCNFVKTLHHTEDMPTLAQALVGERRFDPRYERHTADLDAEVERMRLASEVRIADIWGRCLVSALVGGLLGYCFGAWAHAHWLGR